MPKFTPYFDVEISTDYSPDERAAIAQEIIDRVVSRTEDGIDAKGRPFVKYTSTYAKEKGQDNVDLTFSGDMLSSIEILQSKDGKIRVGFPDDYSDLGKVEGNVLGTYGNDKPVNKGRNFLGITKKELKEILSNYPLRDRQQRSDSVLGLDIANAIATRIVSSSGFPRSFNGD